MCTTVQYGISRKASIVCKRMMSKHTSRGMHMNIRMYACMYVCIPCILCVYIYIIISIHTGVYIYIDICTYTHHCMYIYIYIYQSGAPPVHPTVSKPAREEPEGPGRCWLEGEGWVRLREEGEVLGATSPDELGQIHTF